ncbi:MAG: DNA-deoxyinosine glycosylase [Candidatus Izemoplasmatales bacterium]
MERIAHGFPPVANEDSVVLVLGSFPSVSSRAEGFFYMHPRNRFWRILSDVYGDDFVNADNEGKRRLLAVHGIALYDVVEECVVEGSADASIKDVVYADLDAILAGTGIGRILLNGGTAAKWFRRGHPERTTMSVALPSTSPANAGTSYEKLLSIWRKALLDE